MFKLVIKEIFKSSNNLKALENKKFEKFGDAVNFLENNFSAQYIEEELGWYIGDTLIPNCMVSIYYDNQEEHNGKSS